ncbi:hypothetical protein [Tahibacter sp.]|uniref:hypothetical protein n=1 Tax=Tahibacter sp. TaxID=2056211 RepID=UPI0028C3CE03|nr:hypothetical protein [Tahibacter sp.]
MFRRRYEVRFNAAANHWELWRWVGRDGEAELVADYASAEAAVSGCESVGGQIAEAGLYATLTVFADGNRVDGRTFGTPPPSDLDAA